MCKTASRYPGQPANTGNEYFPDFSKAGLISQTSYRVREIERSLLLYLSDCVDNFFRDKFDKILKQHFKMHLATFSFQSSQRNTCSYTTCTFTMFVFFLSKRTIKQTKKACNTISSSPEFKEAYTGYTRSYKLVYKSFCA